MYVMKYGNDRVELVEMTRGEFGRAQRNGMDKSSYVATSARHAHRWVKNGGLHSTPLYVDMDGRVRRADAGC